MREILFRGKRLDNGEWVLSGNIIRFIPENGEDLIFIPALSEPCTCYHDEKDNIIAFEKGIFYKVDTKTVGQYTGLKDKNGKRIFEGDILHIARIADGIGGYYHPPLDYPVNVVVKWDLCAWMWETLCEDKRYISFPDAWCHYECEVIGNITDNPELLEK